MFIIKIGLKAIGQLELIMDQQKQFSTTLLVHKSRLQSLKFHFDVLGWRWSWLLLNHLLHTRDIFKSKFIYYSLLKFWSFDLLSQIIFSLNILPETFILKPLIIFRNFYFAYDFSLMLFFMLLRKFLLYLQKTSTSEAVYCPFI